MRDITNVHSEKVHIHISDIFHKIGLSADNPDWSYFRYLAHRLTSSTGYKRWSLITLLSLMMTALPVSETWSIPSSTHTRGNVQCTFRATTNFCFKIKFTVFWVVKLYNKEMGSNISAKPAGPQVKSVYLPYHTASHSGSPLCQS
jgi:hypothetical protein